jgi:hypothetical protein
MMRQRNPANLTILGGLTNPANMTPSQLPQVYTILTIITDGEITDMDYTIRTIVQASKLPLSIIIIGVGQSEFTNMHILDADDEQASDLPAPIIATDLQKRRGQPPPGLYDPVTREYADRDIVQFVSMHALWSQCGRPAAGTPMDVLAKEVLAEIPQQVVGYMVKRGIVPSMLSGRTN